MPRYDYLIIFEVDAANRMKADEILRKINWPTGCGIREVDPKNVRQLIGDDKMELTAQGFIDP